MVKVYFATHPLTMLHQHVSSVTVDYDSWPKLETSTTNFWCRKSKSVTPSASLSQVHDGSRAPIVFWRCTWNSTGFPTAIGVDEVCEREAEKSRETFWFVGDLTIEKVTLGMRWSWISGPWRARR